MKSSAGTGRAEQPSQAEDLTFRMREVAGLFLGFNSFHNDGEMQGVGDGEDLRQDESNPTIPVPMALVKDLSIFMASMERSCR